MSEQDEFDPYRKNHPGPESDNALDFWLKNWKKGRADFKWRAKKGKQFFINYFRTNKVEIPKYKPSENFVLGLAKKEQNRSLKFKRKIYSLSSLS